MSSSARPFVRFAPLLLDRRPGTEFHGQCPCPRLGCGQVGHRPFDRLVRRLAVGGRGRQAAGPVVPAGVHRDQERVGEFRGRRFTGGLLLGLGRQPFRLRSKLAEDVLDPRQVRLRLDQLFLGATPPALVATDPGDLLEQRAALLRPEGQCLVDHPLADEQEGVVGEMGGIQQVDQIAQPDAALVEEVIVLARAVQPAPELEDPEVDREQAIRVVEDERDVGHPLGGALLRAGPDDVFRLARAERPTLLSERPAQGVGQVALARPVRPDDRADPGSELDVRSLGERLEALDSEREQARLGRSVAHADAPRPSMAVVEPALRSRSRACAAAAVSAARRDGPSPTPSTSPSIDTSIRNERSWSGPLASTR